MQTTEFRVEDGKYSVFAQVIRCGQDFSVVIGGGECPHIGASALAVPRPSLSDPAKNSASVSVICVTGHKEDELSRRAAERITSAVGCVTSVCAGVHIDGARPEELIRLEANLEALLENVTAALLSAGEK